ncbi:MAG TPA: hypothetical protein VMT46_15700 [Anaerolineaceae bacterium]|nr:hypothetical protein [Anaerolineaceae bacterium]
MATTERRIPVEEATRSLENLLKEVDSGVRIILTRLDGPEILLVRLDQSGATLKGQPNRGATPTTLKGQPNRG